MITGIIFIITAGLVFSEEPNVQKYAGETVTLHVNKTEHGLKDFLWTFGPQNPVTAISIVTNGKVTRVNGTIFADRLHTHVETGSITISNLTVHDSGVFLVQFFTETGILTQTFDLSVHENVIIRYYVLAGGNVTLDPGLKQLEEDHYVKWTQGPQCGDTIAEWKNNITWIKERLKDVLQLNPHTGALTLTRLTANCTGYYCVRVLKGKEDCHTV
ncbi:uncharacterized protein LOC114434740 isoform X2 [Parambassis ranga]|uniref:Uncharacterized protein LOC114434740 isoform X2 n=1 Tax=Parambassis ranga TaxID=210632 RepID=A0A6P7I658_9TELE|nr:uncharacterized protein LOC114434740 isoform X2 [Parambassis ranga]